MKSNKGITLIALIITIILMLILVAVTVAIAVNGGIFRNAKDASVETEKKSLYETIVSAMRISNDGDILIKETAQGAKATIEEDKTKDNEIDRPTTIEYDDDTNPTYAILTVEGNTGTYMYKITGSAILFYNGEDNGGSGEGSGGGTGGNSTLGWYEFREVDVSGTPTNEKNIAQFYDPQSGWDAYRIVNNDSIQSFVDVYANGNDVLFVLASISDGMWQYYYIVDSDFASNVGLEVGKWWTGSAMMDLDEFTEYTTEAVPTELGYFDSYEGTDVICQTYYSRLLASFTD